MKEIIILILCISISGSIMGQNEMDSIIDGRKVETITTYYDNGQIRSQRQETFYEIHGSQKEYYKTGEKKSISEYRSNKLHGVFIEWYKSGNIKSEIVKEDNCYLLYGYDDNKKLTLRAEVDSSGKYCGSIERWHSNGQLKYKAFYLSQYKLDGVAKSYNEKGILLIEMLYDNGSKKYLNQFTKDGKQTIKGGNGQFISYYEDGSLNITCPVVDSLLHGDYKFYKDNKIHFQAIYEDGIVEGPTRWYYTNGRLREVTHMKNGVMEKAERFLPMYNNPVLVKTISVKPSERRNINNIKIVPDICPELINKDEVLNSLNLSPKIYDNKPQDLTITEVYRVFLNEKGNVKEFIRSSRTGYPVTIEIEKSFKRMKFDLKGQLKEGVENEIWVTFRINQVEGE